MKPGHWLWLITLAVVVLFGVFVWPTMYRYEIHPGTPVLRINRVTQAADRLYGDDSWHRVQTS